MDETRHLHLRGALGTVRTEKIDEQEFLIVPVVALMDGVIHAVNASNPERVTTETLSKAAASWNGRPLVLGHPTKNGRQCSANEPSIKSSHHFGMIFNSRMVGPKLLMDAYVDPVRAEKIGGKQFVQDLRDGKPIEVSVGAYVQTRPEEGTHNGRAYKATWLETHGDHLAFLPGGKGACSIDMGCGAHRAAQMYLVTAEEFKILGGPGSGRYPKGSGEAGGGGGAFVKPVPVQAIRSDGNHPVKKFGEVSSFEEAEALVNEMEEKGTWPEGYDAVVEPGDGSRHMFTDQWDDISDEDPPSRGPWYLPGGRKPKVGVDYLPGSIMDQQAKRAKKKLKGAASRTLGGPGSGNHGHAGRPGAVGGSASGGSGGGSGGSGSRGRYKDPDGSKDATTTEAMTATEKAMKSGSAEDHAAAAAAHGKARSLYPSAGYSVVGTYESTKDDVMFGAHDDLQQLHMQAAGDPDFQDLTLESEADLEAAVANITEYRSEVYGETFADEDEKWEKYETENLTPTAPIGPDDPIAKWEANHPGQKWKPGQMGGQPDAGPKKTKKLKGASSRDCSVCGGTGQIKNEQKQEDCPSCEGSGKITTAETNDGAAVKGVQMKKVDAIKALTACPCSGFVPADAKELEAFSEERLTAMAEAATARKKTEDDAAAIKAAQDKTVADLKAAETTIAELKAAAEKAPTEEEYLAKAPESIRTLVAEKKTQDAKVKTDLVTQLKVAAAGVYTEEELNAKPIQELMKLAQMAKVDYSGRSIPIVRAAGETSTYAPPDPYAAGIKALQGKSAAN